MVNTPAPPALPPRLENVAEFEVAVKSKALSPLKAPLFCAVVHEYTPAPPRPSSSKRRRMGTVLSTVEKDIVRVVPSGI